MSDEQYPAAKLVTDEILNRITSESARLERRRVEVQQNNRDLTKKEGEVKKQVALLEQVKQDIRGKSAKILSLDAAATQENRALAQRERAVASREYEMDRREDEVAELQEELAKAKKELHKVISMYNEQCDAYEELEEKHRQTREKCGRLEVDYRLVQTQSSRYEKEAKGLSKHLQQEREKNFDLRRKNGELAEQKACYKNELLRHRGSPMPAAPSPALSAATTTRATPATRKPSGPLQSTPVWARSTIASRARSSLSPPNSTAFASSSDKKIRGPRHDGMSTSFATASPAIRVPSRAATEIGTSLPPSAKSSENGDVSPLLLPGAGTALNDRQQRRQQLLKAKMKTDTYATTPIAAAARDKFRAEQAQLKASRSRSSLGSSVLTPSAEKEGPTTPQQKDAHDVLDASDLPFFGNVNNASEAGSPEKDDDGITPKANSVQKLGTTVKVEGTTPRKPAGSLYQKAKVQEDIESSSLLDDTLISDSFQLPGMDLFKSQTSQPDRGGRAPNKDAPKLESPIDIGKMTEGKIAVTAAKKWGGGSKSEGEEGEKKLGKRIDGTDYKIKSKSFV